MMRRSLYMLKSCRLLSCVNRVKFHSSACQVLCSRFDKDLPSSSAPIPASKLYGPDTDILLDEIKKANSVNRILQLIDMHLKVMNSKHVVTCLENIHSFIKGDLEWSRQLQEDKTFQALCSRMMKVIRLFEPAELITTYKVLSALQIRNNTYVMQCILKMLGGHLNNMSLGQLTFLNFILNKQRHNPLVDGLKLAIPLVIQVQIDQQLDSDNIREVVNCFQIACSSRLKPAVIEKIMNVIVEKASFLTTDCALTVALSLLNLDTPVEGYKELLCATFDILTKQVYDLSINKMIIILRTCQTQRYYHTNFFFTAANHIVLDKWNLESTYAALSCVYKLEFCPPNLLEHFADALCSEQTQYKSNQFYSPLSAVEYLTATSYRPSHIDDVVKVLCSDENKLENLMAKHPNLLVKFFSGLAILGHFPSVWLSKILNEDFLFSAWSVSRKQGRDVEFEHNVLSLSHALDIYDEKKNFNIPRRLLNKCVQGIYQSHVNVEYPLSKLIANGLGGSQFLHNGVFTHDGHIIDHLVAMRSGNYPVSLQNLKSTEEKYLQHQIFAEDIIIPEDAKIIAILVAKPDCFCRDPEVLKGWMDLKVRHLAWKNYSPVVVNHNQWKELPDREKIPFIMREIKQAVQDCASNSTYNQI